MVRRVGAICLAGGLALLSVPAHGSAAAGAPDPAFAGDGIVEVQLGERDPQDGNAVGAKLAPVGVEPGGAIVLAGSTQYRPTNCPRVGCFYGDASTIVRLNPDGSLDPTLGGDGTLETHAVDWRSLVLQPDGKLLAGNPGLNPSVARLSRDGSIDSGFGDGGYVHLEIPNAQEIWKVQPAVQADGRIVVAILSRAASSGLPPGDLTLLRLEPDGSLDPSFGTNGMTQIRLRGVFPALGAPTIVAGGRILVNAGTEIAHSVSDRESWLDFYRFTPDGLLDSGFGSGGHAEHTYGSTPFNLPPVAVDSQGRIYSFFSANEVLRLQADGTHDSAYGPDGVREIDPPAAHPVTSVAIDPADRLLIGVEPRGAPRPTGLVVGRRLTGGEPDPSFGDAGWATIETVVPGTGPTTPIALPDGRVVAAAGSTTSPCAAVVQLNGDPGGADAGSSQATPCASTCKPVHGCPGIEREVTISLHRDHPGRAIVGNLMTDGPGCAQQVDLYRFTAPNGRTLLRSDSTLRQVAPGVSRYRFPIGKKFTDGPVYVLAPRGIDPAAGGCYAARSKMLTVRSHRDSP